MEIERKYAVKTVPGNLEQYQKKTIEQGYLCHKPTIRVRQSNDQFILTYKAKADSESKDKGSANINHEVELPLSEKAYLKLRSKTEGNLIHKTRYLIPIDSGLTAELDIFSGKLEGFMMVEVEFPDEKAANDFVPPSWFGKELTSDKRFTNYHLSKLSGTEGLEI